MYDKIEKDLELVGATAIEDELQDDVAATIETMRLAGMSFFILTGDKRETAINIGRSCGLVGRDARLIDIPSYTEEHKKDEKKNREWRIQMVNLKELKEEKVFLLDASSIIPPDLPMHQTICYRCTPSNKENIVRHVKDNTANLTMAVGDGANDVNMITAADVGIGVKGK
jgi:magnesium-transporting ATPase (P-type)